MQFSGYALRTALMPIRFEKLKANDEMRAHAEKRFGAPLGKFPELSAQVVELFPKYAEELRLLLDRVEASL
jgi:hypothetical protein